MQSTTKLKYLGLLLLLVACRPHQQALVVGRVQAAAQLATTEFTIDKLVYGTESKHIAWVVKLKEARFLAHSQAHIKTGIDIAQLQPGDVEVAGERISIMLPPVRVVNFSYPAEAMQLNRQASHLRTLFSRITVEEQEELFREAERDIRHSLQYLGLVKATQQQTRALLSALLHNLGYTEVYIRFKNDSLLLDEVLTPQNETI